jgi:hypothetical protein
MVRLPRLAPSAVLPDLAHCLCDHGLAVVRLGHVRADAPGVADGGHGLAGWPERRIALAGIHPPAGGAGNGRLPLQ